MASMILKIVYDMDITNLDDEFLRLANECVEKITEATLPGRFWVEIAPFLRHLPSWVPGTEFKKFAESLNLKLAKLLDTPFEDVKRNWVCFRACLSVSDVDSI